MSSAICFNLDRSEILSSGNGLRKKPFERIVGKRKNAGYQLFFSPKKCLMTFKRQISILGYLLFCFLHRAFQIQDFDVNDMK